MRLLTIVAIIGAALATGRVLVAFPATDGDLKCSMKQALTSKQAEAGDTAAQTELGLMYLNGICVAKDNAKAKALLTSPAKQGNTKAMALLATAFHRDDQNSEAIKWARLAADKGGGGGQSLLGWMYYLGQGVPKDDNQALQWARKAAEQGMGGGKSLLALLYQNGKAGLAQNAVEADKWYILACKMETTNKTLQFARRVLEDSMSIEDREEALRRADAWRPLKDLQE